ncbi:MAG: DUF4926 domain-containing protein [Balneolaceae bacterium]|nr:DUF4926 domain-containing protein [Balneolaceae bacterium]
MTTFEKLDTVALLKKIPEKGLDKGQVGTIVEQLDENIFEVEFTNSKGETLITLPLSSSDLMLLHFEKVST